MDCHFRKLATSSWASHSLLPRHTLGIWKPLFRLHTRVKGVFTVALLNCNPVVEVCSWYICNVKDFYFIFYAMYLLSSSLPYPDPWRACMVGTRIWVCWPLVYTKWSTQDLIHAYLGTCVWGHPCGFYIKAVTTCFSQLGFQELLSLEACCSFHGSQSFILTPVA